MAVIRVNATRDGILLGAEGWRHDLRRCLSDLPPGAPVCVLIHGYRYSWQAPRHRADPQISLYGGPGRPGWIHGLGFADDTRHDGLCIAFGWEARSLHAGRSPRSFAQIYRDAADVGAALARLMADISVRADRPLDIVAHSLGARIALIAMEQAPDLPFGRVLLLGAAEFASRAARAIDRSDKAEVYHMMSRANDPFNWLFALCAPQPECGNRRTLGHSGLGATRHRWLDLQLDLPEFRSWMATRGHQLERSDRVSHWHFYTDPGAMRFYRAILRRRASHAIRVLLADGVPGRIAPRGAFLRTGRPSVLVDAQDVAMDHGMADQTMAG